MNLHINLSIEMPQKNLANVNKLLQFRNCRILRNSEIIKEDFWVRNGKVVNPEKVFFDEKVLADIQIDCKGALISPGYLDLQINGGFGVDFSYNIDNIEEGIQKVAKGLLSHGVTAFCPTLVTSPPYVYHKLLSLIKKKPGGTDGASILGLHLEGPFINVNKKGAHPAHCIRDLEEGFKSVTDVYKYLDDVSIITLAPEINNALEVIKELRRRGITVSLGHSVADLQEAENAVHNGATFITHLFNAMLPFHHRDPGLVGLLASNNVSKDVTVYFGIISDQIHTHPAALRIAHRTHPDGLVLVTDAISALGLEDGKHQLGQSAIEVKQGRAVLADTDTLCGSIAPMNKCVQNFKNATSCSIVSALEAATLHPARAIGIEDRKGTLNFGADADFILLGEDLELWSTWIAGKCVYQNTAYPEPNAKVILK